MSQIEILSEIPEDIFSNDSYYDAVSETHFWGKARFNVLLKHMEKIGFPINEYRLGFDIGCGNGVVRRQIEKHTAWHIDGADICKPALQRNNTSHGRTMLYDIHDRRDELAQMYDFIILFDVLEHVENTTPFLESILYHLKPDGFLFINVPALSQLWSRYDEVQGHFRRYGKTDMEADLLRAGLKVKAMNYWGLSMIPLLLGRKWFLKSDTHPELILKQGFAPPTYWLNFALSGVLRIETALLQAPVAGTSLFVVASK